jgi:hypothetical protein
MAKQNLNIERAFEMLNAKADLMLKLEVLRTEKELLNIDSQLKIEIDPMKRAELQRIATELGSLVLNVASLGLESINNVISTLNKLSNISKDLVNDLLNKLTEIKEVIK